MKKILSLLKLNEKLKVKQELVFSFFIKVGLYAIVFYCVGDVFEGDFFFFVLEMLMRFVSISLIIRELQLVFLSLFLRGWISFFSVIVGLFILFKKRGFFFFD